MPSMAKQVEQKTARLHATPQRARKICRVCSKGFDFVFTHNDVKCGMGLCESCDKMLKDGYVAIVCGLESAFVKHPSIADLGGEIVELDSARFAQYKARFNETSKKDPPANS